jgi:DNA invertase Pin-like site-specific DNA recombinase
MEHAMTIYGYARVSTTVQDLELQTAQLRKADCTVVFAEKISDANSDRRELTRLMKKLEAGDVLIVTRLDRLARSTRDLLNLLHEFAQRGVTFKSLRDAWASTDTAQGRLLLHILAGIAEFERELILSRITEGRRHARERGVKFGRKFKLTEHQRREALARLEAGETQANVARSYAVHPAMICRLVQSD